MNKMTNVLILADYLPDSGWGGGVIIRSLIQNTLPNVSFHWTTFSVKQNQSPKAYPNVEIIPFKPRYIRGQGMFRIIRNIDSIRFSNDLNAVINQHQIDVLWIVLGVTYNELYRTSVLSQKLIIPYHVSVHDDPILELPAPHRKNGRAAFQKILRNAATIDVISERMQQNYKQQYNADSIVITRGIHANFPKNNLRTQTPVQLLMGGYANVPAPWPQPLIEAVERLNKDQPYHLHLFDPKLLAWKGPHVTVHNQIPESEFNEILKSISIGYACDDLNAERLSFAQLSLPTKIITYIGAGIPFIYHGPKDSTVGDLLTHYDAGIIVSDNDTEELYNAFKQLMTNYDYYQQNCLLALKEKFSGDMIQKQFYQYLLKK